MPVAPSSLSVAVDGIRSVLQEAFGEDVRVTVDTPQQANEAAKTGNQTVHCLNIFVYRVAPSGFHAGQGSDETQFIRIYAMITPFPDEGETEFDDADLRILGHLIRVLQSNPIVPPDGPPLPGGAISEPPGRREYRLQAILQNPSTEDLNYIWTTQGGELAYRLSACYEFALIPIEPLEERIVADPPRTAMLDVFPSVAGRDQGFQPVSEAARAIPLRGQTLEMAPTSWLPVQMLVSGDALTNAIEIADTATEVEIALAGPPGEEAGVQVIWTLANESEDPQAEVVVPIASHVIDAPEARSTLSLTVPETAQSAAIRTRAAADGAGLAESPFANALTLTVT